MMNRNDNPLPGILYYKTRMKGDEPSQMKIQRSAWFHNELS